MKKRFAWRALALTLTLALGRKLPAEAPLDPVAAQAPLRQEFMAAMQRVRQRLPEPPDSLSCDGFHKNKDDSWTAEDTKPFDVGGSGKLQVAHNTFSYGQIQLAGTDLAVLLDQKCEGVQ